MTTLELAAPQEAKPPETDYETIRQGYHAQAFGLAVNMLRGIGKPHFVEEPGTKTKRIRTTNTVPLGAGVSARLQYVEIGNDRENLPLKRFEILVSRDDEPPTRECTLENPMDGATAIVYEDHVLNKDRPETDALVVDMLGHMREEIHAGSVRL